MTTPDYKKFEQLVSEVRDCQLCIESLPLGPKPVFQLHPQAKLLIAAQAPGTRVHETGLPFNDPSGDRLRNWMGIDRDTFYDETRIAIVPMGFCYPGKGKSGDLPPRPECARQWREKLLSQLTQLELTLVIGQYAQAWHLPGTGNVTQCVQQWRNRLPGIMPLPHPSPRNTLWLKRNPWFEQKLLPILQRRVSEVLTHDH